MIFLTSWHELRKIMPATWKRDQWSRTNENLLFEVMSQKNTVLSLEDIIQDGNLNLNIIQLWELCVLITSLLRTEICDFRSS